VAIGLQNLTEGAKNPLSEYNTAFRRLQTRRRMTPVKDLPSADHEPSIFSESVDLGSEIGTAQGSIRVQSDPTLEITMSAAKNTENLSLTEDPNLIDPKGTAEEGNIESLAGMLDELYNGETLPRLNELDVAFEMDEVEIVEEEPWDDNESDSDSDVDVGALEDERESTDVL
jgi:hypothetical protein